MVHPASLYLRSLDNLLKAVSCAIAFLRRWFPRQVDASLIEGTATGTRWGGRVEQNRVALSAFFARQLLL
jgi:hypothetical protein